jgi:hypothetical protein
MTKIILLDSTPVGLITNPKSTPLSIKCQQWFYSLFDRGYSVVLPEIIDYEVRRELLRVNRSNSIHRLNRLIAANFDHKAIGIVKVYASACRSSDWFAINFDIIRSQDIYRQVK